MSENEKSLKPEDINTYTEIASKLDEMNIVEKKDKDGNVKRVREGKGRHPKECLCDKCVKSRVSDTTVKSDDIKNIINDFNSAEQVQNQSKETTSPETKELESAKKHLISGMMLLIIIDTIAPLLIIKIYGMIDKRATKIKASKIGLDKNEREDLRELAETVADGLINVNPVVLLGLTIGCVYTMKINAEIQNIKPIKNLPK